MSVQLKICDVSNRKGISAHTAIADGIALSTPLFVRFKALASSLAERCRRVPLEGSTKRRPQVLVLTTLLKR
jgi:hypothetical protein